MRCISDVIHHLILLVRSGTLCQFNIAMENGPFIVDFPSYKPPFIRDFGYVSHNQMVNPIKSRSTTIFLWFSYGFPAFLLGFPPFRSGFSPGPRSWSPSPAIPGWKSGQMGGRAPWRPSPRTVLVNVREIMAFYGLRWVKYSDLPRIFINLQYLAAKKDLHNDSFLYDSVWSKRVKTLDLASDHLRYLNSDQQ